MPIVLAQNFKKNVLVNAGRELAKVEAGNIRHVQTISAIVHIEFFIASSVLFAAHFDMGNLD